MNLLNDFLKKNHIKIITLSVETKTAQDAALALKCSISSIVKSLLFIVGNEPLLFLVSGDKKVDAKKLKKIFNKDIRLATSKEVKEITGYEIGAVTPFTDVKVYIDKNILSKEIVYCAAGKTNNLFPVNPKKLPGEILDFTK